MKHWTWTVLNMGSLAYILLVEVWQRLFSHRRATFALREEAVETLNTAWRCSSVSLDLYLDLLKFNVEKSFSHKARGPLEHSGKFREVGGQLSQKLKIAQPCLLLYSLKLALSTELHCRSMSSIWSTGGASCTSKEKGSANIWNVALCVLKSANLWSNSSCSFKMASIYFPPLNGVHPRVPCMLGNAKGLFERAGLSITWVSCRMLWHCHRQRWKSCPWPCSFFSLVELMCDVNKEG